MTPETLDDRLQAVVHREIMEGGFDGSYRVSEFSGRPSFSAGIDTQELKTIRFEYNPLYDGEYPGRADIVMRDLARHEVNHKQYRGFSGCPRTLENHADLIMQPLGEILKSKEYGAEDMHYMANALEDTILETDLSSRFVIDGSAHFFEEVGKYNKGGVFTPFYEAHIRLNMMLWGNKTHKKQLWQYYTKDEATRKKIIEVIQGFLKKSGIAELKTTIVEEKRQEYYRQLVAAGNDENRRAEVQMPKEDHTLLVYDPKVIHRYVTDEKNWPKIAKAYAKEFSKLMQPNYALSLPNHSGRGTKGRETEPKQRREGNIFDQQMQNEDFKQERAERANKEGKPLPPWMDPKEALDLIYRGMAKKLTIKAETYTHRTQRPVFHYGARLFDPYRDTLKHVRFGIDDTGKVTLNKKQWSENMSIPFKITPKGFPEVRFCYLDVSGSMMYNPNNEMDKDGNSLNIGNTKIIPWGDKSKYHYSLLAWYGFLEYLRQNHLLSNTSIGLGSFSEKSVFKRGLADAKKHALSPRFGSQTKIEPAAVQTLFEGQDNLIFTLSDGIIDNWPEIKTSFLNRAKKHHYFHLQVGGETPASKDIEDAGNVVAYVQSAPDLAGVVIDLTDRIYRG